MAAVRRLDGRELVVDVDWHRRITDWSGFGGIGVAHDELLYAASLLADSPDAARTVRGLVAARCQAHLAAGGTVDELAADLRVGLAAAFGNWRTMSGQICADRASWGRRPTTSHPRGHCTCLNGCDDARGSATSRSQGLENCRTWRVDRGSLLTHRFGVRTIPP